MYSTEPKIKKKPKFGIASAAEAFVLYSLKGKSSGVNVPTIKCCIYSRFERKFFDASILGILERLQSLGFVTVNGLLWRITPSGETFLSDAQKARPEIFLIEKVLVRR